ncbi:hypothetical protein DFH09DRAFT_1450608 [Mycena vulgaris]|nr:hypothetical protein DFH09DRAFT_1450608 [Mycena vulgaris]
MAAIGPTEIFKLLARLNWKSRVVPVCLARPIVAADERHWSQHLICVTLSPLATNNGDYPFCFQKICANCRARRQVYLGALFQTPLDATEIADPPSKRVKSASAQTFTKHSRFWALDGNVILQFDGVAFKLRRSRLSTQSVWFEKLFERRAGRDEPLEADEEDIKDVEVDDLDGVDVTPYVYYRGPKFLTAAAVLRAATVFKFSKFLAFTRQYLLEMFSDDLRYLDFKTVPNPTAAVILGRQFNLPGILKRVFYELIRAQPEKPADWDGDDDTAPVHSLQGLDAVDLIRLMDAQKRIAAAWLTVLSPVGEKCPASNPCAAARRYVSWTVLIGGDQLLQKVKYDPICGLDALLWVQWVGHGFCERCVATRKASFVAKKNEIWDNLDDWLNIRVEEDEV